MSVLTEDAIRWSLLAEKRRVSFTALLAVELAKPQWFRVQFLTNADEDIRFQGLHYKVKPDLLYVYARLDTDEAAEVTLVFFDPEGQREHQFVCDNWRDATLSMKALTNFKQIDEAVERMFDGNCSALAMLDGYLLVTFRESGK